MVWVDKVNEWVLKRIRRSAIESVKTDREGITLIRADGSQFIPWSDVQEIAVLKQPDLAIGCFALAIHAVGSTFVIVDDTVAGYEELCQEIPRRLEGVVPYEKWGPRVVGNLARDWKGDLPAGRELIQRCPALCYCCVTQIAAPSKLAAAPRSIVRFD